MASVASAASRAEAVRGAARLGPWLLLLLSLVPALAVHVPTLHFYFYGDDLVPLADMAGRSVPKYLADVIQKAPGETDEFQDLSEMSKYDQERLNRTEQGYKQQPVIPGVEKERRDKRSALDDWYHIE